MRKTTGIVLAVVALCAGLALSSSADRNFAVDLELLDLGRGIRYTYVLYDDGYIDVQRAPKPILNPVDGIPIP